MAIIQCYECGKDVSDSAVSCPGCGAPVRTNQKGESLFVPYSDHEVAVMLSKKRTTNHLLHLILSCVTVFVWAAVVWFPVVLINQHINSSIDRKIKMGRRR